MFSSIISGKAMVFIDFSNVYYAQYTTGRRFELNKFLKYLDTDEKIVKTAFFGAYDEDKPYQKTVIEKLAEEYQSKSNFMLYFKQVRFKGWKKKGNVDTEMGYHISKEISNFDTLILFSGDGDFAHIIEQLITVEQKRVFIFSTAKHIGAELYQLRDKTANTELFEIYDINSDTKELTSNLKKLVRWKLRLYPQLLKFYKSLDAEWIQRNIGYIQSLIDWQLQKGTLLSVTTELPSDPFFKLQNNNREYIYTVIKKWKVADKERLIYFLKSLL